MQVKVLQHHIDEGKRGVGSSCAIALAIMEALPEVRDVYVGAMIAINGVAAYAAPPDVRNFVMRFDFFEPVEPFTFELDYARDLRH